MNARFFTNRAFFYFRGTPEVVFLIPLNQGMCFPRTGSIIKINIRPIPIPFPSTEELCDGMKAF
jgi:hypothetical protein